MIGPILSRSDRGINLGDRRAIGSRAYKSTRLFLCLVCVMACLASIERASAQGAESRILIKGSYSMTAAAVERADFTLLLEGKRYLLTVGDPEKRGPTDYVLGSDGSDTFEVAGVDTFHPPGTGLTINRGTIYPGTVPRRLGRVTPASQVLWMAFMARGEVKSDDIGEKAPFVPTLVFPDKGLPLNSFSVEYSRQGSGIPTEVSFHAPPFKFIPQPSESEMRRMGVPPGASFSPPKGIDASEIPPGDIAVSFPPPYERGFKIGEYLVLERAEISGIMVPRHIQFICYTRELSARTADDLRVLATFDVTASSVEPSSSATLPLPHIYPRALITDFRLIQTNGRPVSYSSADGTWILRSDPRFQKALAELPSYNASSPTEGRRKLIEGIIIASAILCLLIVLRLHFKYKHQ